jgi:holin-like protein
MFKKVIKVLSQIIVIYMIYMAGNIISKLIAPYLIFPGNIIGMLLLFILLSTNIIKLNMVEDTGNLLIKYMGLFFIPLAVGTINNYSIIRENLLELAAILFISCISVMIVAGKVSDLMIEYKGRKHNG